MIDGFEPETARTALMQAVNCAYADMIFVDVEPRDAVPSPLAERELRVAIDMLRPVSSRIEMRMPEELRARIQETLFNGAEFHEGERRDDSILELLNVIAGQFLSRCFGPESEVKLELPQYLYFEEKGEGSVILDLGFDAEGLPVRVILSSIRYRY